MGRITLVYIHIGHRNECGVGHLLSVSLSVRSMSGAV